MAAPQLEQLTILGCPEIDLSFTGDPHRSLRTLHISYYERLVSSATFVNSQFPGLTHLIIRGEFECVKCLPIQGWLPASLQTLSYLDMKLGASSKLNSDIPFKYSATVLFTENCWLRLLTSIEGPARI